MNSPIHWFWESQTETNVRKLFFAMILEFEMQFINVTIY